MRSEELNGCCRCGREVVVVNEENRSGGIEDRAQDMIGKDGSCWSQMEPVR